uniref:Uncharacterized protein n=1 Tax=Chenopodium quinoa TaxID=63459 RepID=A0A803KNT1_CHEQI
MDSNLEAPTSINGGRSYYPSGFFYSAPASPMHFVLATAQARSSAGGGLIPASSDASSSTGSFEFEFSSRFDSPAPEIGPSMSSADELFLNAKEKRDKGSNNNSNVSENTNVNASANSASCSEEKKAKKKEVLSSKGKGMPGGKRRSAHEMHYAANRAQAEEMRKKTFLPYRQGLLGCLGFNSKSYGALNGFARALNPVSSR